MTNKDIFSLVVQLSGMVDEIRKDVSLLKYLKNQQTDIIHKQSRMDENIYKMQQQINSLIEFDKNMIALLQRIDTHGITAKEAIECNKAYKEGFNAAMKIRNFEAGKELEAQIHETMEGLF